MRDRLLGGECTNQLSNFFEGSNEEIKGRKSRCPGFRILVPPLSLSHSPDLSCVGARRATFLGRLLVQPSHLFCCLMGPSLQGYG